ncbi:unnamed protein product, partial [Symbiodinium microadriaticum]
MLMLKEGTRKSRQSTILIFVPGYADLLRMHSWLYWNLPTVGSVNMGYVEP